MRVTLTDPITSFDKRLEATVSALAERRERSRLERARFHLWTASSLLGDYHTAAFKSGKPSPDAQTLVMLARANADVLAAIERIETCEMLLGQGPPPPPAVSSTAAEAAAA